MGELMDLLVKRAREYVPDAGYSLARNRHMNRLGARFVFQDDIDAVVVDFVNFVAREGGVDLALYTKDLRTPLVGPSRIELVDPFDSGGGR